MKRQKFHTLSLAPNVAVIQKFKLIGITGDCRFNGKLHSEQPFYSLCLLTISNFFKHFKQSQSPVVFFQCLQLNWQGTFPASCMRCITQCCSDFWLQSMQGQQPSLPTALKEPTTWTVHVWKWCWPCCDIPGKPPIKQFPSQTHGVASSLSVNHPPQPFPTGSGHRADPCSPQPCLMQNRFEAGTQATPQKCFTCHEKLSGALPFLILLCIGHLLGSKYQWLMHIHYALILEKNAGALGDFQIYSSSNPSDSIRSDSIRPTSNMVCKNSCCAALAKNWKGSL